MANDKDFIVKNAVEVGGSTKTTLGTVTNDDIDLSTGNYFAHSPIGDTTYTISNAGDVQTFQVEVTGGTEEVAQNFSTTLYTGNDGTQTITNGIDLAGEGGLVWIKSRTNTAFHHLIDTERGADKIIYSNSTAAEYDDSSAVYLTSFNSNGFSLGTGGGTNNSTADFVSWTFKKAAGFFDVVTYTGDGTSSGDLQTISHNLGSTPGMIITKSTSNTSDWLVHHRSLSSELLNLKLNAADAQAVIGDWNPTSTTFTVEHQTYESNAGNNENNRTYVAYLFAHDTASDGLIQCGSYTGGTAPISVDLGWQPQWILIKGAVGSTQNWVLFDTMRGITTGGADEFLSPNTSDDETTFGTDYIDVTANGFEIKSSNNGFVSQNSATYIYVAIRSAADLDLTWPTSIEWAGGSTPPAPATGETDIFTISTDDGGTTYQGFKTADNLS